jgi:hypothetical protein
LPQSADVANTVLKSGKDHEDENRDFYEILKQ